jgi:imidazolonepropionase-like amidohydrolase
MKRCMDGSVRITQELRKRGIRTVIGGDYGVVVAPHGNNARDIDHFVTYGGYSPIEALRCATKNGGDIMMMGDELGQIRSGYLADLLLVDGDPTSDVKLLQDKANLLAIMKDGKFHKPPEGRAARREAA